VDIKALGTEDTRGSHSLAVLSSRNSNKQGEYSSGRILNKFSLVAEDKSKSHSLNGNLYPSTFLIKLKLYNTGKYSKN
jgi:hypothetical protein